MKRVAIIILIGIGSIAAKGICQSSQQLPTTSRENASCLAAAKKKLGTSAEVLKCGHLTGGPQLEVVAAIRLRAIKGGSNGIPVAKLAILRKVKSV